MSAADPAVDDTGLMMPMTSFSFDASGTKVREHWYKVDLRPEDIDMFQQRPCYRATICTHFPRGRTGPFTDGLMDAKLIKPFEIKMRPFDRCGRSHASFKVRYGFKGDGPFTPREAKEHVERLLAYIHSAHLAIIWKEGPRGYIIEPDGRIKRKWNLDPF